MILGLVVLAASSSRSPGPLEPLPRLRRDRVGARRGQLVILTGWGGHISLGQFAIIGVGALVAGNLIQHLNLDMFLVLLVAGAAGALVSLVVGLPALRIRGLFLAVTTLAFAVALDQYVLNFNNFPDLIPTDVGRPLALRAVRPVRGAHDVPHVPRVPRPGDPRRPGPAEDPLRPVMIATATTSAPPTPPRCPPPTPSSPPSSWRG